MLKLSMTFETVTQESAENGESEENGFVFEACDCTASELARYITHDGFSVPSCSQGVPRWLSTDPETDYMTGDTETRSIHPGTDKQSQKVWARVLRITGVTK